MKKTTSGLIFKGRYKFTIANIVTEYQKKLNLQIERVKAKGGKYLHLVAELNDICETKIIFADNIIPTTGLALITNNLTDASPTNSMRINYCSVGTGTTAPALGDTTLETETFRNTIASQTNSSGVAYNTMFISAGDDDGTYKEFGLFADATVTLDSGVLFSRVAINITKSNLQTLTIDHTLSLTNA